MVLRGVLCLGLSLSAAACARPSLGEDADDDVIQPVQDAGPEDSATPVEDSRVQPVKDTSVPRPGEDAGERHDGGGPALCADRDRDGVCDAEDNCPDDANPDQVDVCTVEPLNCEGERVSGNVAIANEVRLNNVSINGKTGTLANVTAGDDVTIRVWVSFQSCGGPFSGAQVVLGVGETNASDCQNAVCSDFTQVSIPLDFTLKAPDAKGLHYILAGLGGQSLCAATPSNNQDLSVKVAALCVAPRP